VESQRGVWHIAAEYHRGIWAAVGLPYLAQIQAATVHDSHMVPAGAARDFYVLKWCNIMVQRGPAAQWFTVNPGQLREVLMQSNVVAIHTGATRYNVVDENNRCLRVHVARPFTVDIDMEVGTTRNGAPIRNCTCASPSVKPDVCDVCWDRSWPACVRTARSAAKTLITLFSLRSRDVIFEYSGKRSLHVRLCVDPLLPSASQLHASAAVLGLVTSTDAQRRGVMDRINADLAKAAYDGAVLPIDERVSTSVSHLIRAPLSAHPSTRRIAVPLLNSRLDLFRPQDAPTVMDVMALSATARVTLLETLAKGEAGEWRSRAPASVGAQA